MSAHHEARAKVRSSDEEVPLTHGRGVCGSGNRSHSHPARVPARCGQARPLCTGPLRLLRTTPVTCGITIPSKMSDCFISGATSSKPVSLHFGLRAPSHPRDRVVRAEALRPPRREMAVSFRSSSPDFMCPYSRHKKLRPCSSSCGRNIGQRKRSITKASQMVKIVAQYERTCTKSTWSLHGHCGNERLSSPRGPFFSGYSRGVLWVAPGLFGCGNCFAYIGPPNGPIQRGR
jgi:hypothetical protein